MIGLDTNVVVRYLTQDGPAQSSKATEFIEQDLTEDDPGYINVVVMAEVAWVLERVYRLTDTELAAAIERLLQLDAIVVESEQDVFTAMIALKAGRGSFADALIAALNARAGCSRTVTFDRKEPRLPGFALL